MLNMPTHLSLAADIFLKEASISEVSKKVVFAIDEGQKEFFLFQQYAAFQRKLPPFQRCFSNSTASSPTNHGTKLKKKVRAVQSGIAERKIGNREWRRPREFPKGTLAPCTPSHPFSSTTLLIHTVQLE